MSLDPADDARNSEQFGRRAKKRIVVGIESKNVVPKIFADIEKVTSAGAKIENAQRRRAIEPKVLRPLDVNVDPVNDIFETIDLWRPRPIRMSLAQFLELRPIEIVEKPSPVDGMRPTAEMFVGAGEHFARKKLAELA